MPMRPVALRDQIHRRRADKARRESRRRSIVQFFGRPVLLDMAVAHQHDAIGHRHGLGLIVGHIDHRHSKPLLQRPDFSPHFVPQLGVEIRKWLVHQTDARFRDNGAAEGHPLPLATRQLRWLALRPAQGTTSGANTPSPVRPHHRPWRGPLLRRTLLRRGRSSSSATSGSQAASRALTADKTSGPAPLTVTFGGRTSSDPDPGTTLSFAFGPRRRRRVDDEHGDAATRRSRPVARIPPRLRVAEVHRGLGHRDQPRSHG